jgi:hypothetical protein
MATAAYQPRAVGAGEIKLEYGVAQVFALRFVAGKNVEGRYGPRVLFTAVDERKLWLDAEDGSDLERGMRELGIQPAEFVRVTKIRHAHGGGHSLRVERAEEERTTGAQPWQGAPDPQQQRGETRTSNNSNNNGLPPNGTPNTPPAPRAARYMAAYKDAADVLIEAKAYMQRKGFPIEIRCEDLRCLAATMLIDAQKGGRD